MKSAVALSVILLTSRIVHASPAQLADALARDVLPRDYSKLGNLVNGILNGSLPGVSLPSFNLPLGLGSLSLKVPPVVAIGRKAIPDADHPFQAPGPTDQRGVTNLTEILYASQEMLGLGVDSAAALVGALVISAIDITTQKVSIGNSDIRTNGPLSNILGQAPGLFDKAAHSKFEVDGSVAYTDSAFAPDGNTNHFNSSKWATAVQVAQANNGLFGPEWLAAIRYQNYNECVQTNPQCSWEQKEIAFYAGEGFIPTTMPSADPSGVVGPPTIATISAFFGVTDNGDGTYAKGPEKLPPTPYPNDIWYRRSVPVTAAEIFGLGVQAYLVHPVVFGSNSGKGNSFTGRQAAPQRK
ncbi:hypothetical protein HWV62_20392 [Athelia sp. TMB]|nr:hypothetical protein HWV62_20392 [Athelia sp. TMB]